MTDKLDFGDLSKEYCEYDSASIVIIPVPYDATSTWIKGSAKGPKAIIEASANMELYDIETDSEVYKKGIFTDEAVLSPNSPEKMVEAVAERTRHHLSNGKFCVLIGGEHSVSIGSAKAHAEKHYELTILQLDAHSDLRDEYNGSKYNHACTMARVKEFAPIVQVGIRSMDSAEKKFLDKQRAFFAKDIYNNNTWSEKVVSLLTEKVYVTIDLDVFDPSIMPCTGTPEPGGLLWYNCLELLKKVCDGKNVVGFDIVELCPDEKNKAPNFLAAKLIYKLLSYKFRE